MSRASKKYLNLENLLSFSPFYISLFFYYLSIPSESLVFYSPVENTALDCGSSSNTTALDGRIWVGDINSEYPRLQPHNLSVTSGPKFIRLHFYPASYPEFDSSKAFFSVKAGPFTLLNNFSAALTAKAPDSKSFSREFCINVGSEKRFNITFTPSPDSYAFINGIEVVSMPSDLNYTAAGTREVKFIGQEQPYLIDDNKAMETGYRVNVGGKAISPANDTGMYRRWFEENDYLVVAGRSVVPVNLSIPLNFTKIPNYTAPEELYRTARTMGKDKTINKEYKLTWEFEVDSGFFYMVRLHFCEFQPEFFDHNQRIFYIYIANQIAEKHADVIQWTGGRGIPISKDYVVQMFGNESQKKMNLSIALQVDPNDWETVYNDAILNGLEIFKISSDDNNLAGPNPDSPPTSPSPPSIQPPTRRKTKRTSIIIGIVSGLVSGIVLISIVGFFIFRRGKKVKEGNFGVGSTWWGLSTLDATKSTKIPGSTTLPSDLCRYFSLAEIKEATNNFDSVFIIGAGGFGNVYRGYINGSNPVAIKRLKPGSQQGAHEFETEIEMLSQLRHVHLVSLIGYCNDGNEMILVYDYMARGTLRDHLYNTNNSPLSWKRRMEICIGAAHGLNYLHTGAKHMIIHRDVKTTNILLDEEWTAKVCDFGLSKLGPTSLSKAHVSTVVKGSFGYLDPEYYLRQQLTEKSDVYSFGVVLCEVLCAKPPITRTVTKESVNLVEWVKRCRHDGKLDEIVDPFLKGTIAIECLKKFVEIATNCLLDNGTERPSMNDVVWGLEFTLQLQENARNEEVSPHQFEIEMMDAEKALIPKSIVDDSGDIFSSSDGQMSSTNSNSKVTITSKEDQSLASLDSDGLMSVGAVFSEIYIPKGR
ncbi:hypothetical protein ACB092_06G143200 [Castanea dentata]